MNRTIHTEIEINAPAERVWGVLSDFERFPEWNPFITNVEGMLGEGEKIRIDVEMEDSRPITLPAVISSVVPNRELVWGGDMALGLFRGEHFYRIEPISDQSVKFIHGENFSGPMVRLIWRLKGKNLAASYVSLNNALKQRAEEAV